jgi:hypothetical protein
LTACFNRKRFLSRDRRRIAAAGEDGMAARALILPVLDDRHGELIGSIVKCTVTVTIVTTVTVTAISPPPSAPAPARSRRRAASSIEGRPCGRDVPRPRLCRRRARARLTKGNVAENGAKRVLWLFVAG